MIEEDQEFHARFPGLYFMAKRGLLDYLLLSTWEYRFDYHRELFRTDRRPPRIRAEASGGSVGRVGWFNWAESDGASASAGRLRLLPSSAEGPGGAHMFIAYEVCCAVFLW